MSTIAAGTASGTALVSTGDTTGQLVLQTNGTTTAVTIGTNQVVTLAQPLPVASGGTGGSATPTAGGIVYGTGTVQAVTAAGTSGQLLQSNAASAPTWVTASGSGLVCIAVASASTSSSVDFTTGIDSTYDEYEVHFQNVIPVTSSNLLLRTSANSGSSYAATSGDYSWSSMYNYSNGTIFQGDGNATSTGLFMDGGTQVTSGTTIGGISGVLRLINPAGTASVKHFIWDFNNQNTTSVSAQVRATGSRNSTAVVNAVRFIFSSGNIASGLFKLYGLRKSV